MVVLEIGCFEDAIRALLRTVERPAKCTTNVPNLTVEIKRFRDKHYKCVFSAATFSVMTF